MSFDAVQCHNDSDTEHEATVRKFHGKVEITWSDSFIDNTIAASVNDSNPVNDSYSLIGQVMDESLVTTRKWAHLDGVIVPDGTYYPMPGNALEAAENQVGWYGEEFCDSSGEWLTNPTLITTFAARPMSALSVVGDNVNDEYPVSFDINIYTYADDSGPVHTEQVVDGVGTGWVLAKVNEGDSQAVKWDRTLAVEINSCEKMELIIKKWSDTGRVVKITEFYSAITITYTDDDIVSMKLLEESEIADGTLPVGNISCNELALQLQNVENEFYYNNTASPIHTQLKVNRKIVPYVGIELDDSSETIYWVKLGTFFSGDWQAEENSTTAGTTARDRMEQLRKSDFEISLLYENITLYELTEIVLNDAKTKIIDLQWNIDSSLNSFSLPFAWFEKQSYFNCIKQIAQACAGRAYMDRDDVLQIETDL